MDFLEIEEETRNENPNEIIEIEENEEVVNTEYDLPKQEIPTNNKNKKRKLSKNAKIIIIVSLCILLIVILLVIYFVFIKKDKIIDKPQEEVVIVEKDNYRYENGKLIFKNDTEDIGEYTCTNKNENLCYIAYFSNEDDFDTNKKVYENGVPIDIHSDIINDNFVFIYDNTKKEDGNIILYDIKNKEELGKYLLVKEIDDTKVVVKTEDGYNVLVFDEEVSNLFKKDLEYIGFIEGTNALVTAENKNYQLVDFEGKDVSKSLPGEIKSFDTSSISVLIDKEKFVYDYNGTRKINSGYDYIRFVGNYIICLDGKKLYVFDSEGSKMNYEAIKINSTSYNTKLIFNDALRQTGKEMAFDAYTTNGVMKIEFDDEAKTINLYEGIVSKTLAFVDYFSGKLYFYGDADKTDLIGSYTCKNANVVGDVTTELTNCYIARENNILKKGEELDNGYLPIYNKRFVFISDNDSNPTSSNIIVYNLKDNKAIVTYREVDAGIHKNNDALDFAETAGTLLVAKNSNDSYGVVNMGSSSISGVIPFSDDAKSYKNTEVKYLDNYLLFKRSDNSYHLYDTKGSEITKSVKTTNEIVEYNGKYIVVKTGNENFQIYSLDGTIVSIEAKEIIMEDNYYITISPANVLGVYKYSDKTNLILEEIKVDQEKEVTYIVVGGILFVNYTSDGVEATVEVTL